MKIPYWFFCFIILFVSSVSAQDQQVKWDGPFAKYKHQQFLGADVSEKVSYFLSTKEGKYHLLKTDANNQILFERELNFSKLDLLGQTTYELLNIKKVKDRLVALLAIINKKESTAKAFLQDISLEGEMVAHTTDMIQARDKAKGFLHMFVSPDSSKVGVCLVTPEQKGIDHNKIEVVVYDHTMNLLSSREISYDDKGEKIFFNDALLTNEGNVYFVAIKFAKGIPVHEDCLLWYLAKESSQLVSINMDSINPKLEKYKLQMNASGELVFIGLYREKGSPKHVYTGYYYGKIYEHLIAVTTHALPDSIQYPINAVASRMHWNIYNREEGGLICVLEYTWDEEKRSHFGYVLVFNIDQGGALRYGTCIFKNQSQERWSNSFFNYNSFLAEYDKDRFKLNMYFNDHKKNNQFVNEEPVYVLGDIKDNVLIKVEIDQDGKVTKKPIAQSGDREIFFGNAIAVKLVKGELIVMGLKKDDLWLGKITDR